LKRIIVFAVLFASVTFVNTLFAYNIELHIENFPNNRLYLGVYYGANFEVIDTTYTNNNGYAQFKDDKDLKQGVYFVVLPPHTRIEFLLLDDQEFVIKTDLNNVLSELTIENLDYEDYFVPMQREIASISLKKSNLDMQRQYFEYAGQKDSADYVKREIEMLNIDREAIYRKYLELDDDTFLSKMIRMMLQPEFLEDSRHLKYSEPGAYYQFYKTHYFDRVDFSDDRILRTPEFVFDRLIKEYCTYFVNTYQETPDSAYNNLDFLINKSEANPEVFKYVISYLSAYYAKPPYRGMEFLFVYLVDKYFLQNEYEWVDESTLERLKAEADEMRFNLVGNSAVDIELKTTENKEYKLHSIDSKYTLLWFWEPDCKYCTDGIKKILEVYDDLKQYQVEIISIYVGTDQEHWLKSITDFEDKFINLNDDSLISTIYYGTSKTPRSFILDSTKTIIVRDIDPKHILSFLQYIENKQ
jgi:thioredoxin-related protein